MKKILSLLSLMALSLLLSQGIYAQKYETNLPSYEAQAKGITAEISNKLKLSGEQQGALFTVMVERLSQEDQMEEIDGDAEEINAAINSMNHTFKYRIKGALGEEKANKFFALMGEDKWYLKK
ncbi:MAG: hypothetical protein RQ756_03670 [Flavobacteriaceae bacterium]|nr:hypothetical protein [Flavobacteriaceae bacterium]